MEQLVIDGRRQLSGKVRISGAKNAALPCLAATLLAGGNFRLSNVPVLRDVKTFLQLLEGMGTTVSREGGTVSLDSSKLSGLDAPYELVRTMRASVLVLGPLLARCGKARVSLPGGCAIGARPIDIHLKGLELMGARIELKEGYVEAKARRLEGALISCDIPTVTGTENLMMAAALAKGRTTIKNAAREPEVVALGEMLMDMGARIRGLGTANLEIEGVKELSPVSLEVIPDRIEAGTYIMAAGAAGGEVILEGVTPGHLQAVMAKLREAGLTIDEDGNRIRARRRGQLHSVDVKTSPYPGFPTDLQAQFMVLMAIAKGLSVITETIFENRFMHVAELARMGADIVVEGRSAIVRGGVELTGAPVMATDLRASASLVLAGLAARGTTIINRVYHLDRGYECMEEKLSALGAHIRRERSPTPY